MHPTITPESTPSAQLPLPASVAPARRVRPAIRRRAAVARRLASELGQGTVEYVGLLLLMATVLAGIVAVSGQLKGKEHIGEKVVQTIGKSIDKASSEKR